MSRHESGRQPAEAGPNQGELSGATTMQTNEIEMTVFLSFGTSFKLDSHTHQDMPRWLEHVGLTLKWMPILHAAALKSQSR